MHHHCEEGCTCKKSHTIERTQSQGASLTQMVRLCRFRNATLIIALVLFFKSFSRDPRRFRPNRFAHVTPVERLKYTLILNVPGQDRRLASALQNVESLKTLGPIVTVPAATPQKDGCEPPYSVRDCCSVTHLRAVQRFVEDTYDDHLWVLVLEDDIAIHPGVRADALPVVIQDTIAIAARERVKFIYFGVCTEPRKACDDNHTIAVVSGNVHLNGCSVSISRRCTHAYAVRRDLAVLLPQLVRTGGTTIDVAYERIWVESSIPHIVAGANLRSPDHCRHLGVFFQHSAFWSNSLTKSGMPTEPCHSSTL